eukprot:337133-Pyramimonas_sp.AAC.2
MWNGPAYGRSVKQGQSSMCTGYSAAKCRRLSAFHATVLKTMGVHFVGFWVVTGTLPKTLKP